jgi:peptide/nickel transport system substrate-binding protein
MPIFRILLAALVGIALPAHAADLTIGRGNEQSSMDPLFARTGNNQMTAKDLFDRLITTDADLGLHPGLAVSWSVLDPLTWEIRLRSGVRFHDGTPFTAEDVAYSLARAKTVPNSPAPFNGAVTSVAAVEIVDPLTLRVRTVEPSPQLMEQIGLVFILPHTLGPAVATSEFNAGKAVIGTGPYRFKEWVPNDRMVLTANKDYWGDKPAFDTVTVKFIKNDAARVAALLSGSVDLIDAVPPADVERLGHTKGITLSSITSARIIYAGIDAVRDKSPFVTDKDGKPIEANPLKDRRVRLALSKLINRTTLVERGLNESGEPAGQMVPKGMGGFEPALPPQAFDPQGAKALLAEAGYPAGFGLTVHSSNDRFPADERVAQIIGQMLARGGIKVNGVATQPYNLYAGAAGRQEFSFFLFSYGSTTSNASNALLNVLATWNREAGTGAFNRTRYSNPAFDAALKGALSEFDEAKRDALLRQAARIAAEDVALIPLYWQKVHWAGRAGVTYRANRDEETTASNAGVAP